ncbi:MAG: thioredoxin domain-containing protein [Candidatus Pelagibacterales bacterium]
MSKNYLDKETSPYLLQHKDNPVHWLPWSERAFEKAKNENKPILLSIGYSACHWCHVMAHESFEDEETARIMNDKFINIKLDREERPDLDNIYQNALTLLGQQGGWPLTMFLADDKKPFWGGTYFPKDSKYGRPAFKEVLNSIYNSFTQDRNSIIKNQELIFEALNKINTSNSTELNIEKFKSDSLETILDNFDLQYGGIKGAPKFPQIFIYDFLLNIYLKDNDQFKLKVITQTLDNICSGGIYDHVAGGISRYSVDDMWLVPHFEKMLYDNAQLLLLLSKFSILTGNNVYREIVKKIADWIIDEMQDESGGYYSALDADSEGVEGKYYIWSYDELEHILKDDIKFFSDFFYIEKQGNWEGSIILSRYKNLHIETKDEIKLQKLLAKINKQRQKRMRPQLDDKILTDWNGLTIEAMAYTGKILKDDKYLKSAESSFKFITKNMLLDNKLYHSSCKGINKHLGMLDDYVYLIKAGLMLYEVTNDDKYLSISIKLTETVLADFAQKNSGFSSNSINHKDIILRSVQYFDNVTPNSNAVLLFILNKIYLITHNEKYALARDNLLNSIGSNISNQYFGASSFLKNYNVINNSNLILITGKNKKNNEAIQEKIYEQYTDESTIIIIDTKSKLNSDFKFYENINIEEESYIYVCRDNTCSLPFNDINLLKNYL